MEMVGLGRLLIGVLVLSMAGEAWAQSASEIAEQARARARQVEEVKQVLNDPDQNVRLAAFEAMVASEEPLMRELALDAGLNSTDKVMRGLALRHAVLGLSQLTITLSADGSAPKPVQERSRKYLERYGSSYVMAIDTEKVDLSSGAFHGQRTDHRGNISGTVLTFSYYVHSGELHLQDDNTLAGTLHYTAGGDSHQFKASAPVR